VDNERLEKRRTSTAVHGGTNFTIIILNGFVQSKILLVGLEPVRRIFS